MELPVSTPLTYHEVPNEYKQLSIIEITHKTAQFAEAYINKQIYDVLDYIYSILIEKDNSSQLIKNWMKYFNIKQKKSNFYKLYSIYFIWNYVNDNPIVDTKINIMIQNEIMIDFNNWIKSTICNVRWIITYPRE